MGNIDKAKTSVLGKIHTVKDICLKHVANAKLAALNYVATGASMDDAMTTALAIVTTPMTQDHLDQLKDASTIELWDRMEAKTDSLRLVKQMKHSALEAYYKIRADAVSAAGAVAAAAAAASPASPSPRSRSGATRLSRRTSESSRLSGLTSRWPRLALSLPAHDGEAARRLCVRLVRVRIVVRSRSARWSRRYRRRARQSATSSG